MLQQAVAQQQAAAAMLWLHHCTVCGARLLLVAKDPLWPGHVLWGLVMCLKHGGTASTWHVVTARRPLAFLLRKALAFFREARCWNQHSNVM